MSLYDDFQSFLEDVISSKSTGTPVSSVKSAKQSIAFGEDPLVAAQNFRTAALAKGWPSQRVERKVRRIQETPVQPISADKYTYGPTLVQRAYQDLYGRAPTESEIQKNIAYAGAKRINPGDVNAFESFLNDMMISSPEGLAKVKTPEDIEWERKYGPLTRSPSGELQRGMLVFRPEKVAGITKQLREASFSPIAGLNLSL